MMQLHMGNWLLLHEYLQSATGTHNVTAAPIIMEENDEDTDSFSSGHIGEMDYTEEPDDLDFGSYEYEEELIIEEKTEDEIIADEILEEEEPFSLSLEEEPPAKEMPEHKTETEKEKHHKATIKKQEQEPKFEPDQAILKDKEAPKNNPVIIEETHTEKKEQNEKRKDDIPLFFQNRKEDSLIQPIYTEDYFLHQGLHVSDEIPKEIDHQQKQEDKSLMVVMSFSEWLIHFKTKGEREKEEQEDQKALKTMWQKEKLAAALEEENEEIPETVFEMAVNSITKEEDLASEPLAEIMVKQGKYDKAIDMYRKLSLRNPQKKTYFARKIDALQKEKES